MTCEERREQIFLLAAGALAPGDDAGLRAHLGTGCPRCAGSLAEAETALGQLPLALDPVAPSPLVKRRLMARIETHAAAPLPEARPAGSLAGGRALERWLSPLLAAGIAAFAVYAWIGRPLQQERELLLARLADQSQRIEALETAAAEQVETARLLGSRDAVVAMLAGSEPQPQAWGRILWDSEARSVHFFTGNLKPLPQGRTYELWLITDGQEKVPVGTFGVDPESRGRLLAKLPHAVGNVVLAAVTDEPEGGVPQPTGSIQLVGKLAPSI